MRRSGCTPPFADVEFCVVSGLQVPEGKRSEGIFVYRANCHTPLLLFIKKCCLAM
jgi:hypothetical protein